eukprot:1155397-Pelagomonas_calceolata.AAC.1
MLAYSKQWRPPDTVTPQAPIPHPLFITLPRYVCKQLTGCQTHPCFPKTNAHATCANRFINPRSLSWPVQPESTTKAAKHQPQVSMQTEHPCPHKPPPPPKQQMASLTTNMFVSCQPIKSMPIPSPPSIHDLLFPDLLSKSTGHRTPGPAAHV